MTGSFGWLDVIVFGAIAGAGYALIAFCFRLARRAHRPEGQSSVCPSPDCRAINLPGAQYCYRCGHKLS